MADTTWMLLQLCVAGWTGLLMWGVVRLFAKMWGRLLQAPRPDADLPRHRTQGAGR